MRCRARDILKAEVVQNRIHRLLPAGVQGQAVLAARRTLPRPLETDHLVATGAKYHIQSRNSSINESNPPCLRIVPRAGPETGRTLIAGRNAPS